MEYGNILRFTANVRETYTHGSHFQNNYNKSAGVRKGLPDLTILTPRKILFLELKRTGATASAVSPEQREWIRDLNIYGATVVAKVCFGYEESINFITSHIETTLPPQAQSVEERDQAIESFSSFLHGES